MNLFFLRRETASVVHDVQSHRIAKRAKSPMYLDVTLNTVETPAA
jgi:hypothetical protein